MELTSNQIVNVLIEDIKSTDGDFLDSIEMSFTTSLFPMYSSPSKVRSTAGAFISEITDDVLVILIHKYSSEADYIKVCNSGLWDKWNFYTSLWVTYRATIDALMNSENYLASAGTKIYKKLGDFAVSKDTSINKESPIAGLLKKLECETFKLMVSVIMCKEPLLECDPAKVDFYNPSAPALMVKGMDIPGKPVFGRTFTQDGRFPGWTGYIEKNNRRYLTNYKPIRYTIDPRDNYARI